MQKLIDDLIWKVLFRRSARAILAASQLPADANTLADEAVADVEAELAKAGP